MMIHEKIMSGQFLLDRKNDRSSMLHSHSSHHHLAHHSHHHHQPPSPPMPAMKMDLYSAYAYQQQLQQHLIGSSSNAHHKSAFSAPTEVLDLSRRCDSVETPRKTPSPYQTNSSFCTNSPSVSPVDSQVQQPAPPVIPTNLLYSAQAQQHQQQPHAGITLPSAIASLYPAFYYPGNIKQEPISASSPPPPAVESSKEFAPIATSNLLQTFASAAAAASAPSMHVDVSEPHSPDTSNNRFSSHQQYSHKPLITTPTSSTASSTLAGTDVKATRPFKTFPRDPLVIAANFAATDVLLDNPRVERYTEYRKRVLEQIRNSNGGSRTITNPKMRRTNSRSGSFNDGSSNNNSENEERNAAEESSDCDSNAGNFEKMTTSTSSTGSNADGSSMHQTKDAAYYERRRKNNAAAKKSRDRRRIKEDEIAIRAAYLERQNIELLCQIDGLKAQLAAFTSSKVGA